GDRLASSWKPPHRKTLIPMYRPVPALSLPRPDKTEHRLDKTCAENSLAHTLQEPCIGLPPMPAATRVPHARAPKRGGSSVGGIAHRAGPRLPDRYPLPRVRGPPGVARRALAA